MKYFMDTEFIDDGKTIDLISIGIVAEDGREMYLQSVEFNSDKASEWVQVNVLFPLSICPHVAQGKHKYGQCMDQFNMLLPACPWRTRRQLKHEILTFMDSEKYGKPELWGWITAYDFVAFCQIFGTMMDLPADYPHYMHDLQHILDERGISDEELPPQEEGLHNALADARHIKRLWGYIVRNDCWQ